MALVLKKLRLRPHYSHHDLDGQGDKMPGIKRTIAESEGHVVEHTHPSRKRRVGYSDADAQQAKTYNDLADDIQAVRLKAARTLLERLSVNSPNQVPSIREALTRLVKGLCSGRKAARIGFSIALCEVLRLAFGLAYEHGAHELHLGAITEQVFKLTEAESKASGQEKREYLLGRRFAFQAILQSDVALVTALSDTEWQGFLVAVAQLAKQKPWLRTECGAMLNEYVEVVDGKGLSTARIQAVISVLQEHQLLKTAEGLALWLSIADRWPEALPKDVWHKKDPLSSDELLVVKKIMQGSSADEAQEQATGKASKGGARQSQPSFAWKVILTHLYKRKEKVVTRFWEESGENGLFASASSAERKYLGLQIVCIAVATTPVGQLKHVLGRNTMRTIINHRAEPGRTLFEAAKLALDQVANRVRQEPSAAGELINALLAEGAMDQSTKTKTIEVMVQNADSQALYEIATALTKLITVPIIDSDAQAESRRRAYADLLLGMIRAHREPSLLFTEGNDTPGDDSIMPWVHQILRALIDFGYCTPTVGARPAISEPTSSMFCARLMSCLSALMDQPPREAIKVSSFVVRHLQASEERLRKPLNKQAQKTLSSAQKCREQMLAEGGDVALLAYRLLFDLSTVPIYDDESDSIESLQDLISSFQARQEGSDSATMLVELLLSFVSKASAVFRKLAERVFNTFASELTSESLQSLLDILQQKESLSGQQALFEQKDDGEEGADSDSAEEDDDGDKIDADDMSDVELANGEVLNGSGTGSSEEDSDASSDEESSAADEDGDDEEAIFDRKLAAALGTTGMEDSDEDGSDMDDDQMLALEPHLANIFKERKKDTGKKQENKDAKENIVNFKNRVLDLLGIYVKTQYENVLALDLILPLTALVRTTSSKPTAEKAFAVMRQYFEACNKHKALPQPEDHDACFQVLSELHLEMKLGGSKLHANACSRSSLFLSKMLVALDQDYYKQIATMYGELQSEWYLDPKSKVQAGVFTEWTSWSLATRKQQQQK